MKYKSLKYACVLAGAAFLALASLPGAAKADTTLVGYSNAAVDLLAGPGSQYPVVVHLDPNQNLNILGCVNGFSWCDVSYQGTRGWMDGHFLDGVYQDHHVNVIQYGTEVNPPTVVFEQKAYWDSNYHDRPFYSEHRYWTTTTTTP